MLSEIGKIVYLRATYGSDKGKFRKGDTMLSNFNLGNHAGDSNYSNDRVEGEALPDSFNTTAYNVSWYPVEPGSIEILDATGTVKYVDDGNGNIFDVTATGTGTAVYTVNYGTGVITPVGSPAAISGYLLNYTYNNMDIKVA